MFPVAVGFIALTLSLVLTAVVRDYFTRKGVVDLPDSGRRLHVTPTPRVGGIAIVLSYGISFCSFWLYTTASGVQDTFGISATLPLLVAVAVVFITGLMDDLVGLLPLHKFTGQVLAACIAYFSGVQLHLFQNAFIDHWLSFPLSIVWLVVCSNAFNLIDGMDGLAAGLGACATLTMIVAGLLNHNTTLILVATPLLGSLIGFLRYNFNPASIFLGDCGSLTIGFFLGCCGALWGQKTVALLGMTAPVMALFVPLLDTFLAILRRTLRNKPIFGGDRGHIHHRLLDRGLKPGKVAFLLYGVACAGALLSLLVTSFKGHYANIIIAVFCGLLWIGIRQLEYAELLKAWQMFSRRRIFKLIDSEMWIEEFRDSVQQAQSLDDCWRSLLKIGDDLGFCRVRMQIEDWSRDAVLKLNESACDLNIRLGDGQFVILQYPRSETHLQVMPLNVLLETLQSSLRDKLQELQDVREADIESQLFNMAV
jgi:UDP-GlcNAc:undecaprenyl-phosphate GlcNAc-1-phosphate transferase